jgi:PAS domain S-box-containing protein
MLTAYWGVTGDLRIVWPDTVSGWLLLLCYVVFFMALLIRGRGKLSRLSIKQWILLVALSGLALVLSQLFPLQVSAWLAEFMPQYSGEAMIVALLSAVPYLLAGAILGPIPALLVGFFTGLGRSVGLTQQPYDPFYFAFAAWLAAQLMQQNYQGRFYYWLRMPLVSGTIGQTSTSVFVALVALVNSKGLLASLDAALAAFQTQFWPMLFEGLVSGAIVTILVKGMSQWLPKRQTVPSPYQRSVRTYLLTNYLLFGSAVLLLSTVFVFGLSIFLSSRNLVTNMAASGNAASERIEDFRSNLEEVLSQSSRDEDFARGDKASAARALGRLYRSAEHFQEVMLIDEQIELVKDFPPNETELTLTELEHEAVTRALDDGLRTQVLVEIPDKGRMLSLIAPVVERDNQTLRVIVGRVQTAKLIGILDELLLNDGSGLVIDREEKVISTRGGDAPEGWSNPELNGAQSLFVPTNLGGEAFLMENARQSRAVHYLSPPNGYGWRVVTSMPYEFVLNQAFASVLPVVLVLLAVMAVFYARFASYGNSLTGPISDLARASRSITAGDDFTTVVDVDRQDEVGELGRAFTGMHRALKGRLDELSLLRAVSQDNSTSININQGMPVILQGALRGTGAAGARAVILNPSGRVPLSFAEGPAGEDLAVFDRPLMLALRDTKELSFNSLRQMSQLFEQPGETLPAKALFAIPLQSQNRFLGIFFLGYRQPREFDNSERDLLHTLAGQATVLVDNAHLFAKAEGGRQRLSAVLSSTREAVLVTDQTERILILNKAMERTFNLSCDHVIGRTVSDVFQSPQLVRALTQPDIGGSDLEIEGKDGRTYFANVSTIVSRRGQVMGRVAVLHDVTQLKEVDRIKSEFVSNVSHDLKSPLTIISGYASQLAMTENLSTEQREYTDNIIVNVERMVNLVDNLLDLGRLEAGMPLVYDEFAVEPFLTDLADDHWLHAHNNGVSVRVKVAQDVPPVTADQAWLYQAIANLLRNGFKYAPDSGEMILSAVQMDENVVISLHDKGPGIADQDQVHLFEKFYRVKRHGSGNVKGTGLGLAMVKSVAERHGGRAWCQSELGKGSVFSISLPLGER